MNFPPTNALETSENASILVLVIGLVKKQVGGGGVG